MSILKPDNYEFFYPQISQIAQIVQELRMMD